MSEWKTHTPDLDNLFSQYQCGLVAGQQLALRKDLGIFNHMGDPTGEVHLAGEIWQVLPGVKSDTVRWFRRPDGERHIWDDDTASIAEWFRIEGTYDANRVLAAISDRAPHVTLRPMPTDIDLGRVEGENRGVRLGRVG